MDKMQDQIDWINANIDVFEEVHIADNFGDVFMESCPVIVIDMIKLQHKIEKLANTVFYGVPASRKKHVGEK
jgi:hypothetical protein